MRALFVVIPERGHVNPYIGPAQALRDDGVDVVFWAAADIGPQLRAAGLPRFVGPTTPPASAHRGADFVTRVDDAAWLRRWITTLLVDDAEAQVEPLRLLLRQLRPDVVVIDPMIYAAAIACLHEGVPWAALSSSLNPVLPDGLDSELLRTVRALDPARQALFARHGFGARFRGCDLLSPHLTVAFTTAALVGDVPGVALVGPSLPRGARGDEPSDAWPWHWLDGRPLVYASFGSQLYHQPRIFRRLIEGAAGAPLQLLLSAAELARDLGPLPPNVLACAYVPQLALLGRASAFVTHGGANSVMEALACGVPLLLAPQCNDQFHNAHFVEQAGVGRRFDPLAEALGPALAALEPLRPRVAAVAASYARDGAAETARLLRALSASA